MNYAPHTNVAIRAARQAGARAIDLFNRRHELDIRRKEHGEWVSNADTIVERELLHHLKKSHPHVGIQAEESGDQQRDATSRWIVDPIDGTHNFIAGLPHFALSIALAEGNTLVAGVVYAPISDELFVGERGRGAFLNDRRIRVGKNRMLSRAMLATGFPERNKSRETLTDYLDAFQRLFLLCHGIRRQGSAALDLCYTADGRYDGFWECGLAPWDIAAGAIILQEAGGLITDFTGGGAFLTSGNIVAANAAIHSRLLANIQESARHGHPGR